MEQSKANSSSRLQLSASAPAGSEACLDLLTVADPSDTAALLVTNTNHECARKLLQAWEQKPDTRPARRHTVFVGDFTRSARSPTGDGDSTVCGEVSSETVTDASDLVALGIAVSETLDRWDAQRDAGGPDHFVVCFDSVTALLQDVDLPAAFRFLHVLSGRLRSADAVGHFHLDPRAHDDETLATLRPLFDTVVEDRSLADGGEEPNGNDRLSECDVRLEFDWAHIEPAGAVIEAIAVLEDRRGTDQATVLQPPLQTRLDSDALNALVRTDAVHSISLDIADYHVHISENTVGITRTRPTPDP